jgi:hypothetical protein
MSTSAQFDPSDIHEPTPQDDGFPDKASIAQRECWFRQEQFLEAFAKCGKIGKAAQATGMSRSCVERWQGADLYGFQKRMAAAHDSYVELLEEQMDKTIETKPAQTQILQIFRLKAEHPEKYREEVKVMNADAPFQMLDRLKEMAMKERERQAALEAASVEGIYQEVPPNQEPAAASPTPPAPTPLAPPAPPPAAPPRAWRNPPQRPPGTPPGWVNRR